MIDFTDVLTDPELGAETLTRIRIDQTLNHGRAINSETELPFTGIVTTSADAILERSADGAYIRGSILVTTATPLRVESGNPAAPAAADVVRWNGRRYNVGDRGDFSVHGFNWAICVPDGVNNYG